MDKPSPETVEAQLEQAARVMRRLPPVRAQGFFNTWPAVFHEFSDLIGREPERMRLPPPSSADISQMDKALEWLRWLEVADAKLVWDRVSGARWKQICCRFGITRATANRRYEYALALIAWRLSGRSIPAKRSRAFVVERTKKASSTI